MTTVRSTVAIFAILLPALLAAAPAESGAWSMSVKTDPIDDSKSAMAVLAGTADDGSDANLFVSCDTETTLNAAISWHDPSGRKILWSDDTMQTPVTYRFPPAKAMTERSLNIAEVTFFEDPILFLRKLVENERLVARAPLNILDGHVKITVEFDLAGARATIGKLAEVCGWSLDPEEKQTEDT